MLDTCGLSVVIWVTLAPLFFYWVLDTFFMRQATTGLDLSLLSVGVIQIVTRGMVQIGIN